jgi:hypothetical protein
LNWSVEFLNPWSSKKHGFIFVHTISSSVGLKNKILLTLNILLHFLLTNLPFLSFNVPNAAGVNQIGQRESFKFRHRRQVESCEPSHQEQTTIKTQGDAIAIDGLKIPSKEFIIWRDEKRMPTKELAKGAQRRKNRPPVNNAIIVNGLFERGMNSAVPPLVITATDVAMEILPATAKNTMGHPPRLPKSLKL